MNVSAEAPNFCLVHSNLTMPDDAGVVAGGGTTREYLLEENECPLSYSQVRFHLTLFFSIIVLKKLVAVVEL